MTSPGLRPGARPVAADLQALIQQAVQPARPPPTATRQRTRGPPGQTVGVPSTKSLWSGAAMPAARGGHRGSRANSATARAHNGAASGGPEPSAPP